MDAANQRGRRSDVVRELILQARGAGRYRGSIEELVPLARDPYCIVPLAVVLAKTAGVPGGVGAAIPPYDRYVQPVAACDQTAA